MFTFSFCRLKISNLQYFMFTLLTRLVQRGNKINICVLSSAVSRDMRFPSIAVVFKCYNFLELSRWYFSLQMFQRNTQVSIVSSTVNLKFKLSRSSKNIRSIIFFLKMYSLVCLSSYQIHFYFAEEKIFKYESNLPN